MPRPASRIACAWSRAAPTDLPFEDDRLRPACFPRDMAINIDDQRRSMPRRFVSSPRRGVAFSRTEPGGRRARLPAALGGRAGGFLCSPGDTGARCSPRGSVGDLPGQHGGGPSDLRETAGGSRHGLSPLGLQTLMGEQIGESQVDAAGVRTRPFQRTSGPSPQAGLARWAVSELPSSEDLDPSTGTDAPTPPTMTGPSSYTLNWEEPDQDPAWNPMPCRPGPRSTPLRC